MPADPYLAAFGQRLAAMRQRTGLTQAKLAKLSGLTGKYISEIERGATNASLTVLRKLASGLKTTPAVLLDEEDTVDRQILAAVHARTLAEKRQVLRLVGALFVET